MSWQNSNKREVWLRLKEQHTLSSGKSSSLQTGGVTTNDDDDDYCREVQSERIVKE